MRASDSPRSLRRPWVWLRAALWVMLGLGGASALLLAAVWALTGRADGTIVSAGQRRTYRLHVPQAYDGAVPVPLVISLHGFAEWPGHLMHMSRWNDMADRHGFIAAYPAGTGFPRRWTIAGRDVARDEAFIADLIDALAGRYNIDPDRIYVNGMSNGGGMTQLLACRMAGRIAAAGSVAGAYLYPMDACNPARPVPFIAFHGTADPIVPYAGGPSARFDVPFPDVPRWIATWAGLGGCDPIAEPLPPRGAARGIRYAGCRQDAEVVFYTIEGGGHSWPGSAPLPRSIVGHTSQDIDATATMWEFFSRHTLGD